MDLETRIYNGNRAKEVLENEAFLDAMEVIKTEIKSQWSDSPARDEAGRQNLWLMLKMAEKFHATLKTTLETGKLAELELTHKRTIRERLQDAIG